MTLSFVRTTIQSKTVIGKIEAAAAELNCTPSKLCLALLTAIFRDGMTGAVLDGAHPDEICPDFGKVAKRQPIGIAQQRFLAMARAYADDAGEFCLSLNAMAKHIDSNNGAVIAIIRGLERRGILVQVSRGARNNPSRYRIIREALA